MRGPSSAASPTRWVEGLGRVSYLPSTPGTWLLMQARKAVAAAISEGRIDGSWLFGKKLDFYSTEASMVEVRIFYTLSRACS